MKIGFFEEKIKELISPKNERPPMIQYRKESMSDSVMPEGGRNLKDYEEQLMFNREELRDKSVLDLGAGPELKLAKELKETGITSDTTSLSPSFGEEKYANQIQGLKSKDKAIAGLGQKLCFKDESFDNIFALHINEHISTDLFLEIVLEMARTLKIGGKAIIGPMDNEYRFERCNDSEKFKKKLDKWGVEVEKVMIPEEVIKPFYRDNGYGCKELVTTYNIILRKKTETK